jgi:hypothetical protein
VVDRVFGEVAQDRLEIRFGPEGAELGDQLGGFGCHGSMKRAESEKGNRVTADGDVTTILV